MFCNAYPHYQIDIDVDLQKPYEMLNKVEKNRKEEESNSSYQTQSQNHLGNEELYKYDNNKNLGENDKNVYNLKGLESRY